MKTLETWGYKNSVDLEKLILDFGVKLYFALKNPSLSATQRHIAEREGLQELANVIRKERECRISNTKTGADDFYNRFCEDYEIQSDYTIYYNSFKSVLYILEFLKIANGQKSNAKVLDISKLFSKIEEASVILISENGFLEYAKENFKSTYNITNEKTYAFEEVEKYINFELFAVDLKKDLKYFTHEGIKWYFEYVYNY